MKQNGVRLVQRKFAQGVPIPTGSSGIAPLPPERKAEPPYSPKNVYHNNMSAKGLLDIVAMQNIHKHKQEPLVVLERLRADEIPSPLPKARARMRKRKLKTNKNNNMCLRSGKRKSPDALKGPTKKRKKLSSESTDDLPLKYYFNQPAQPKPQALNSKNTGKKGRSLDKEKHLPTPKKKERISRHQPPAARRAESIKKSDVNSFAFKEPSSPARFGYGLLKKKTKTVRELRRGSASLNTRWASLRSARAPSEPRMARPLRAVVQLGKKPPKPAARKGPKTVSKDDQPQAQPHAQPGPSGTRAATPLSDNDDHLLSLPGAFVTTVLVANIFTDDRAVLDPSPTSSIDVVNLGTRSRTFDFDSRISSLEQPDWCVREPDDVKPERISMDTKTFPTLNQTPVNEHDDFILEEKAVLENNIICNIPEENIVSESATQNTNKIHGIKREKEEKLDTGISQKEPAARHGQQSESQESEEQGKNVNKNKQQTAKEKKKRMPASKANKNTQKPALDESPSHRRLLRNSREPPPIPDVYEFNAELEASRPPSSLRRRGPAAPDPGPAAGPAPAPPAGPAPAPAPTPTPTSPDVEYVDILPASSTYCMRITPKKRPENGEECVNVGLVNKEEISIKKKKNLIENLNNFKFKFLNCLTADMQTELDNLITADGLNEPQPSTSKATPTYLDHSAGTVCDAPVFYPTAEEFSDPIEYIERIAPRAAKHGICKIVPPENFKPPCNMNEVLRFVVIYQYISKMYNRWGPVSRELAAIKSHLRTQSVVFGRSPLLDGSEVNLSKLFHVVERYGGLNAVTSRKRWARVAEDMKLAKLQHPERKLDSIYMRYLLPYATLSNKERQNIMADVEKAWTNKYQRMLSRASNPFQRQNRMLGNEIDSDSEDEAEDSNTASALHEAEDCIVYGRAMNLATFKKIATALMDAHFTPSQQPPSAADVEKAYWRAVVLGTEHIVANTASIDTGEEGYGFPKNPETEYGTHPWNLKVVARNPNNVLRYLGSLLGVTVPTLHLNMLFSTSCWHRDPHGLPWIEYMHSGADKIWYGIPKDQSDNFRRAVETLCPAYCQNKSIWLASEITMVPPNILSEHGVKLCRLQQRVGEYVVVFPEAHSCSITTGFGISESVYFASNAWLTDVYKLFQELRNSCEPTMFSLEQLLLNGSLDNAAPPQVCAVLSRLLLTELEHRRTLDGQGLHVQERPQPSAPLNTSYFRAWNTKDQDECEYCRSTLFLSKVTGLTGRKSAVCPEHALCLLHAKKYKTLDPATLEFVSSFSTAYLADTLERLEARIAAEHELECKRAPSVIDLTGPADSSEPPADQE